VRLNDNTGEISVGRQFIPEFYDTLAEEILADISWATR